MAAKRRKIRKKGDQHALFSLLRLFAAALPLTLAKRKGCKGQNAAACRADTLRPTLRRPHFVGHTSSHTSSLSTWTSRRSSSTKCKRRSEGTKSATKCVPCQRRGELPTRRRPHVVGYTSSHTSSATLRPTRRRLHFVAHTLSATLRPTLRRLHFVAHTSSATLRPTRRRLHFVPHFVGNTSSNTSSATLRPTAAAVPTPPAQYLATKLFLIRRIHQQKTPRKSQRVTRHVPVPQRHTKPAHPCNKPFGRNPGVSKSDGCDILYPFSSPWLTGWHTVSAGKLGISRGADHVVSEGSRKRIPVN